MTTRQDRHIGGEASSPETTHPDWQRLGDRIRGAREKLSISLTDLAARAHVDDHTLHRVEAGEEDPGRRVVEILDREFGAEGVLLDAWARVHIGHHVRAGSRVDELYHEAGQIRVYAPLVIPEHFQTEAYTRALDRAERPLEPHHLVRDRARLPRVMAGFSGPPYYCLVVDETALYRTVESPETTREQLAHLYRLAQASHVTVHVIPSGAAPHPGLGGAFWTLSFSPRHALAYIPYPRGPGALVTDATHIKGYTDLFATLQGAALPATESLTLLQEAADRARPRPAITEGTSHTARPPVDATAARPPSPGSPLPMRTTTD